MAPEVNDIRLLVMKEHLSSWDHEGLHNIFKQSIQLLVKILLDNWQQNLLVVLEEKQVPAGHQAPTCSV